MFWHACNARPDPYVLLLLCWLQGCGLVVFSQHSEAAAALETLHGRFVWPGARSPMVIEWCDSNKQHKRKRAQPLAHTAMMQAPAEYMVQYVQQPQQQQQLQVQLQQPLQHVMSPNTTVVQMPAAQMSALPLPAMQLQAMQIPTLQMPGQQMPAMQMQAMQVPAQQIAAVQMQAVQMPAQQVPQYQMVYVNQQAF
jgi:hypothetical protein